MRFSRTLLALLTLAAAMFAHAGRPMFGQNARPADNHGLKVFVQSGTIPVVGAKLQLDQADLTSDTPTSIPIPTTAIYDTAHKFYQMIAQVPSSK